MSYKHPNGHKVLCIKTYKTEIDILDLPKIEHIPFIKGKFYEAFEIDSQIISKIPNSNEYYIEGEDTVGVSFDDIGFNKYFVVGTSNIRNAKLAMVGILD